MGDLNAFVPEEKDFLSGVFYKIGVWIGHADDDGECSADAEEEKVLMKVLEKLSVANKDIQLISQMTGEAARQVDNHERWAVEADNAVADAVLAGQMIKTRMNSDDLSAYKVAVGEVARSVATAFREGDDDHQGTGDKIRKFLVKLTNKDLYEERNISPAEDTALNELADAMQDI